MRYLLLLLMCGCALPQHRTPVELAQSYECSPDTIAYWIGQHDYKVIKGWNTAEECMAMTAWDCKCSAVISRDALNACGYRASIQTFKHGKKVHAVTLYTSPNGKRRGFIDNITHKAYSNSTPWDEVIDGIGGGPWVEY